MTIYDYIALKLLAQHKPSEKPEFPNRVSIVLDSNNVEILIEYGNLALLYEDLFAVEIASHLRVGLWYPLVPELTL